MDAKQAREITTQVREFDQKHRRLFEAVAERIKNAAMRGELFVTLLLPTWQLTLVKGEFERRGFAIKVKSHYLTLEW